MSIEKIKIKNTPLHIEGNISFEKSKIVSIIGMNGHGKTLVLNTILSPGTFTDADTGEKNTRSFQWTITGDYEQAYKELPIFSDDEYKISYNDTFVKDNFNNSTVFLAKKIIEYLVKTFESGGGFRTEADERHMNLVRDIKNNIGSFTAIPTHLSRISFFAGERESGKINPTITKLNNWFQQGAQKINTLSVDPRKQSFIENLHIYLKEDGVNFRQQLTSKTTLHLAFISTFGIRLENINTISMTGENRDKLLLTIQNEFNKQIKDRIRQDGLNIEYSFSYNSQYKRIVGTAQISEGNIALSFDSLSTGTKNFLNIMSQIGSADENTVIVIDEPDQGLHPSMQTELRQSLEEFCERTDARIVLATHSIHMLSQINRNLSTYVSVKSKPSESKLLSAEEFHNDRRNNDLPQIWDMLGYEEKFNPVSSESKVIIVEGETDVIYVNKFLKELEIDNVIVISGHGSSKIPYEAKYYVESIKINKENILVMFDGDVEDNARCVTDLTDYGIDYFKIPVQEIEGIFTNNDERKFTKKKDGKFINKLSTALKFSFNKDKLARDTIANIEVIKKEIIKKFIHEDK